MSKLRDRIRDISRRRQAAFGFAAARAAERTQRQVLVIAEATDANAAGTAAQAGVDAVIHTGDLNTLAEAVTVVAGACPVGARIAAARPADTDAVVAAGADFLVFDDNETQANALLNTSIGYVANVADTDDADFLRLIRPLDLDGVVISAPAQEMTVRDQLRARRIADLVRKPLFAKVDNAVGATVLEVWRDAGVVAVVSPADAAVLGALVSAADLVPRPREVGGDRREVVLPAMPTSDLDDEDDDPF